METWGYIEYIGGKFWESRVKRRNYLFSQWKFNILFTGYDLKLKFKNSSMFNNNK